MAPEQQMFAPSRRPWIAAAVLVLIALILVGVLLLQDDGDTDRTAFDPSPTATSESPTPTPSPSETSLSPSPSPTVSATPSPSLSRTPSRSASPTRSPSASARPSGFTETRDGRPGWGRPEGGCYQATAPSGGSGPHPDLSIELVLPAGPFRTGTPINATLRVRNSGTQDRPFTSIDNSDDGVLIQGGQAKSAYYFTSASATVTWNVPAGGYSDYAITVQAEQCGDISTDPAPALPPGSYQIVAALTWRGSGGTGDVWATPVQNVTLSA